MGTSIVKFKYAEASAELSITGNGMARLRGVYSKVKGKGHGSALMREITKYADEHRLRLVLVVQRFGYPHKSAMSNEQLIEFYKKFGFRVVPQAGRFTMMRRDVPSRYLHGV